MCFESFQALASERLERIVVRMVCNYQGSKGSMGSDPSWLADRLEFVKSCPELPKVIQFESALEGLTDMEVRILQSTSCK